MESKPLFEDRMCPEQCPCCGMSKQLLYSVGHMGCAKCYDVFEGEVEHALKQIHGRSIHIGKIPDVTAYG